MGPLLIAMGPCRGRIWVGLSWINRLGLIGLKSPSVYYWGQFVTQLPLTFSSLEFIEKLVIQFLLNILILIIKNGFGSGANIPPHSQNIFTIIFTFLLLFFTFLFIRWILKVIFFNS